MFKKPVKKGVTRFFVSFGIFIALSLAVSMVSAHTIPKEIMDLPHLIDPSNIEKTEEYAPGEILVKFNPSVTQVKINSINSAFGTSILETIPQIDVYRIEIPSDVTVPEMVQKYLNLPGVEFAEPNGIYYALTTLPDDPYYTYQWALPIIEAPEAWDIATRGEDVSVAIVDSGVDLDHPDLADQVGPGYDFVNDDSDPRDDYGHGTHCAGITAANANNGIGIAGLSRDTKIMAVKVLGQWGWGTWDDIAQGINYAADNDARIISLSLGGYTPSSTLEDAVNYAYAQGCLLVAAAGNDDLNTPFYPAAYPNVMAVAATNSDDLKAWYSNFGSHIEVSAPGGETFFLHDARGVLSTMPTYWVTLNNYGYSTDYDFLQGTSMACPYVAGLGGCILSRNPYLRNDQVREYITDYVDDLGSPGRDQYYGYGRINAWNTLDMVPILWVGEFSEVRNFPNPFILGETDQVTIAFPPGMNATGMNASVTIKIYNTAGQLVRTLDEEGSEIRKDKGEAYFDGRNDNGEQLASGLYPYVIQGDGEKAIGKMTLIK